ncbi:MAG: hypothetical protein JWL77_1407 [Chthonomonadaceae bacterium]|nr:hypothetical protein [Chthonomonadaceae bacterium]
MGYSREQFPVTEPLVADLVISYAFDENLLEMEGIYAQFA